MKNKSYNIILNHIGTGSRNAEKYREIRDEAGVNERVGRQMIEDARRDNVLICADNDGFYRPENVSEGARWLKRATNKALSILATTTPIRRWLKAEGYYEINGQMSLSDYTELSELSDALNRLDDVLAKMGEEV